MTSRVLPLFVVSLALGHTACGDDAPGPADTADGSRVVTVEAARIEPLPTTFEAGGVIRARTTARLASRIVAEVREVRVVPGQRVRPGQPLVILDGRELVANRRRADAAAIAGQEAAAAVAAELRAAEAALALAKASHARIAGLAAKGSATPQELDEATAALDAATARIDALAARQAEATRAIDVGRAAAAAAQAVASYAVVTAPFAGIVTEKLIEPGNIASPGTALLTVEDDSRFRLDVTLDESRAALVRERMGVAVLRDAAENSPQARPLDGTVAEVSRRLDAGSHMFLVKIDLPPGEGARSGAYARARFSGPTRPTLTIPASCIVRRGQLATVFVIDDGSRARLRLVNTGVKAGDRAEVLAGLDAGERVVVNPPAALRDGAFVRGTGGFFEDGQRKKAPVPVRGAR